MLAMYIYHFLYVMKTRARQTRSFTLREGATRSYGIFFFNQLLTLSGREIIKLAAYMTYFQNESIYIHKARLLSDACIVNNYR